MAYDDTIQLTARKENQFFIFAARGKEILFDLSDNNFKRKISRNRLRPLAETGVKKFFRGINPNRIPASFGEDTVYKELFNRLINHCVGKRSRSNFGTLFSQIHDFMHLESYLKVGIKVEYGNPFSGNFYRRRNRYYQNQEQKPQVTKVDEYSKPVIRFMRESGFAFGDSFLTAWKKNSKLVTDLCTYVMEKHHDNLLIYKHLNNIITNENVFGMFMGLVMSVDEKMTHRNAEANEAGFGAEYKALFEYVIYTIAAEAMTPENSIQEYFDYLKMARRIKQMKELTRRREAGDTQVTLADIQNCNYRAIEKYPKGLSVRHRIVTRNFGFMNQRYDEEKFSLCIDSNYAWGDKEFCIVTPTKSDDIKNEGTELNHCVGSYIQAVLDGRTQVVFMRRPETKDQSLVTVEIRSRGIQQARGYANRSISGEESAWLEKYAKKKNLTYGSVVSDESKPCPTPKPIKKENEVDEVEVDSLTERVEV